MIRLMTWMLVLGALSGSHGCAEPTSPPEEQEFAAFNAPRGIRVVDDLCAWSPNSRVVAYHRNVESSHGPPGVYLIERDGANNRLIVEGDMLGPRDLRFSPDGGMLAMVIHGEVHLYRFATGELRQLTYTGGNATEPDWAPDGERIVYAFMFNRSPADSSGLYIIDVRTGTQHPLFNEGAPIWGGYPRWSPKGEPIAFWSGDAHTLNIFHINSAGTGLRQITNSPKGLSDGPILFIDRGDAILYRFQKLEFPGGVETRKRQMKIGGADLRSPVQLLYHDALSSDGRWRLTYGAQDDSTWVLFIHDLSEVPPEKPRQLTMFRPRSETTPMH